MNKEQKIVFRNGSVITCLPEGENVRGHRAEVPFIECEPTLIIPDALLNKVLEPFMTRRIELESKVFDLIAAEQKRQDENIELIASENFVSENVMQAVGSCLTNKYAEGYPAVRDTGNKGRYYGGCECVDAVETYCCQKWREVFQTDYHVNVQPHSGSSANLAAYMSVLKPGETILSMSLHNGGHLTHGSPVNFSGKLFNIVPYDVGADGYIDYGDLEKKLIEHHPQLVLAGASAYSRIIDFARIGDIIKRNSDADYHPYFMVDMAHIAGLVAAGDHPTPFGIADIITTTTHKTLRGPRGGMIFCRPELAKKVDSAVFPCTQGGPLEHVIAGKAVCAEEALTAAYHGYIHQVVRNCKAMAAEFMKLGFKVVSGGTDNHLFLLDLTDTGLSGKQVQDELDKHHITLNKNMVPGDKRSPVQTSGVRIGTAAMTTKGYREADFIHVADRIANIIRDMQVSTAVK
nr:MAG TPA: serine hydroxymethyltransferase [Caudoviricetes sp.]